MQVRLDLNGDHGQLFGHVLSFAPNFFLEHAPSQYLLHVHMHAIDFSETIMRVIAESGDYGWKHLRSDIKVSQSGSTGNRAKGIIEQSFNTDVVLHFLDLC